MADIQFSTRWSENQKFKLNGLNGDNPPALVISDPASVGVNFKFQIFLGIVGGCLGSLFVFLNLKLVKFKDWLETFTWARKSMKVLKVLEVIILIVLTATISTTLPLIRNCKTPRCYATDPIDANKLGQPSNQRYLESCNTRYEGEKIFNSHACGGFL